MTTRALCDGTATIGVATIIAVTVLVAVAIWAARGRK